MSRQATGSAAGEDGSAGPPPRFPQALRKRNALTPFPMFQRTLKTEINSILLQFLPVQIFANEPGWKLLVSRPLLLQ
jgi:hypothetical protein